MKIIKQLGLVIFVLGFGLFWASIGIGSFTISENDFEEYATSKGWVGNDFYVAMKMEVVKVDFSQPWEASSAISSALANTNQVHMKNEAWDKVIWDSPQELSLALMKKGANGAVASNPGLWLFLTFGLCIIGGLMFVVPNVVLDGPAGIKNNGIQQSSWTNGKLGAVLVFSLLVTFYLLLYFAPSIIVNWVIIVTPVFLTLFKAEASQWSLYGLIYCTVMFVMGVRMFIKYRHNKYQMVRTASVLFFQFVFAFILINVLPMFNLPGVDLKNAWPLDYSFLYDYNVAKFFTAEADGGYVKGAIFFLVWGGVLSLVVVPVLVYFYGKRWYCSWVCGCGGLAETLGDPYRQLSDKSLFSWKIERVLIYSVLLFAIVMTAWTGIHSYRVITAPAASGNEMLMGISAFDMRKWYGLLIGSIFSGVIGTGFYPVMGNRVWCRFGCPLAAYMGLVQRFKSRFRITTNGGQCISCGNCSTYCEQGIDVRWYAQRGENIVRSSCVGCGVCSAVCPRGVLKLENGPEENRIIEEPIFIGHNHADIKK